MKYKDIKAGETYNMRVKVISTNADSNESEVATIPVDENGKELKNEWAYYSRCIASAFSPITPENGIENIEPAPKYDLCRLFRKGDKVKLRKSFFGRETTFSHYAETKFNFDDIYTIEEDEEPQQSLVAVASIDGEYSEEFCFYEIELITPVEELEPFYVCENTESKSFEVRRKEDHKVQAAFYYFNADDAHAKSEAAKATLEHCDLLNAEHRKGQK